MNDRIERTEWCDRVGAAIVDGRILEDPGYWRPHVERCDTCRPRVEGLLTLRKLIEGARLEAPICEVTPEQDREMIRRVFERFRRRRRRQSLAGLLGVLLAAGAGTLALTRPKAAVETARDPVAYATELHRRVFPPTGRQDLGLLKKDPELQAEYIRALDDPSSLVRRTALVALAMSGIRVDVKRLEAVVRDWSETLDSPVELASFADGEASIRGALAVRRTATLHAVLAGALGQAEKGAAVSSAALVGLLRDPDAETRRETLMALSNDASFVPGEQVSTAFVRDPDAGVRAEAAACLLLRGGPAGLATVLARLRSTQDFPVEQPNLPLLGQGADVLAFHRERVASAATPIELALLHEFYLVRAGERSVPPELVARALGGGPEAIDGLASVAVEADLTGLRPHLQDVWRARSPAERNGLGQRLARWDSRTKDPARLQLALDICEAQHDKRARELVVDLSRSEITEVRERAQALLKTWPAK